MTIPDTADVQFMSQSGRFYLDSLVDPSGVPTSVLDIDLGFTVSGRLELPSWLTGTGLVRLFADELGGPIDQRIGATTVAITGAASPNDPGSKVYNWTISVASNALPDPSPDSSLYRLGLAFVFQNPAGGHTDIGAFFDLGTFLIV